MCVPDWGQRDKNKANEHPQRFGILALPGAGLALPPWLVRFLLRKLLSLSARAPLAARLAISVVVQFGRQVAGDARAIKTPARCEPTRGASARRSPVPLALRSQRAKVVARPQATLNSTKPLVACFGQILLDFMHKSARAFLRSRTTKLSVSE